jgi:cobalt-zinc-cadmium efflux system protein
MEHGHDHVHEDRGGGAGRFLGTAFWVTGAILAAEVAGGLLSHSLALLSDAGHMLTDVLSLGLAWYAARLASRPPTPQRTYGYRRAGILAALFNAGTLIVVAGGILAESVGRFVHPVPVTPWIMGMVAGLALAGNLFLGLRLGHGGHDDLNVRSAWLHVMGDAAASGGVLLAGLLILVTGRLWWDPMVSVGIALLIARGAWGIVAQTIDVLMEGTPRGLDPSEVAATMESDEAVLSVHHVHVWTLDGVRAALSGHLVLRDVPLSETEAVVGRVGSTLRRRFGIDHTTLQLETGPCPDADCRQGPSGGGRRPEGGAMSAGGPAGLPDPGRAHLRR